MALMRPRLTDHFRNPSSSGWNRLCHTFPGWRPTSLRGSPSRLELPSHQVLLGQFSSAMARYYEKYTSPEEYGDEDARNWNTKDHKSQG